MRKLAKDIHRIGLVANSSKPVCKGLVREAAALIAKYKGEVVLDEPTARFSGLNLPTLPDAPRLSRQVDLLMVFGGDGTLLRVARDTIGSRTPIVGINAGGLGFLTDVPAAQLPVALEQIFAGQTVLETRSMLQATGHGAGQPFRLCALNEFVIGRGAAPRLLELDLRIDGDTLTRYRCDGVIVCTPTGSTAYSLAAGGAVVSPDTNAIILTPICPHTLSNRSVIIGLHSKVEVEVLSRKIDSNLTADGQVALPLQTGDVVTIQRARHVIRLLHLSGSSFFKTLRRKLNWSGTNVRRA